MKNTKVVLIVLIFSLLMYSSCAVPVLKREEKPWNNCYDWEKTKFVTIEGPFFLSSSTTTTNLSLQLLGLQDVIKFQIIKSFINKSLLLITLNIFQKKVQKVQGII